MNPKAPNDDYKSCEVYAGKEPIRRFELEGEYYFSFNQDGKTVLRSEGYASEAARDNGIVSIKANTTIEKRWVKDVHRDKYHYVALKAGNHQEIGRSCYFESEEELALLWANWLKEVGADVDAILGNAIPNWNTSYKSTWLKPDRDIDEYLPMEQYKIGKGLQKFQHEGEEYFAFNTKKGDVSLRSQGYVNVAGRDNGIKSVKKNSPVEKRWSVKKEAGKIYYSLKAGNHQEIARSPLYDDEKAMALVWADYLKEAKIDADKLIGSKLDNWKTYRNAWEGLKKPKQVDDYLPTEKYKVGKGIQKFTHDEEEYFAFNTKAGEVSLRSEGYGSTAARDNGIESVKKNSPNDKRWTTGKALNDKYHYYALKAGNHQEVARSPYFEEEKAMAFAWANYLKEANIDADKLIGSKLDNWKTYRSSWEGLKKLKQVDDYLPTEKYQGKKGIHKFEYENEHYFAFNLNPTRVTLRSEGYGSTNARDNGIESVKKNSPIEKRWVTGKALNDKYYYYALKAGNHQEIARSPYYKDEKTMALDWASFLKAAGVDANGMLSSKLPNWNTYRTSWSGYKAPAPIEPPKKKERIDNYMPCNAYKGGAKFHKFKHEGNEHYFFSYNDRDGDTLMRSEGYTTEAARDKGIESVKNNTTNLDRYINNKTKSGKYFFALKAGNHQEIARSCYHDTEKSMALAWAVFLDENGVDADAMLSYQIPEWKSYRSSWSGYKAPQEEMVASATLEEEKEAVKAKIEERKKALDVDNYLPYSAYKKGPGYVEFKDEKTGQYFFAFNDKEGKVILRSEGYNQEIARNKGRDWVKKQAQNKDNYIIKRTATGQNYFVLMAGKTEIARSCYYKKEKNMALMMAPWMASNGIDANTALLGLLPAWGAYRSSWGGWKAPTQKPVVEPKVETPKPVLSTHKKVLDVDNYLPCSAYRKGAGYIEFKDEKTGQYFFAFNDKDGKVILRSEAYHQAAARDKGRDWVRKQAKNKDNYIIKRTATGQNYFVLMAGETEIARSCYHKDEKAMALLMAPWMESNGLDANTALLGLIPGWAGYRSSWGGWKAPTPKPVEPKVEIPKPTKPVLSTPNPEKAKIEARKKALDVDNYLPCSAYRKGKGYVDFKDEKNGQYYFAFNDEKGNVILRSEGYHQPAARNKARDWVKKQSKNKDNYIVKRTATGQNYFVLMAGETEIARSCYHKKEKAMALLMAPWMASNGLDANAALLGLIPAWGAYRSSWGGWKAPTPKPVVVPKAEVPKPTPVVVKTPKVVKTTKAAPVPKAAAVAGGSGGSDKGGCAWWWLLPLLLLALLAMLLMRGCDGCNDFKMPSMFGGGDKTAVKTPVVEEKKSEIPVTPPVVVDSVKTADVPKEEVKETPKVEAKKPTEYDLKQQAIRNTKPLNYIFNPTGQPVKTLTRLGTNPEFGSLHGLDNNGFYNKLKSRYAKSPRDAKFLDGLFKAMGYSNGFSDITPAMISQVAKIPCDRGNIGFSKQHKTVYANFNLSGRDLEAFKIKAANGKDIHFMKTCGNHMYCN